MAAKAYENFKVRAPCIITKELLIDSFKDIGLTKKDTIFVHASLSKLGEACAKTPKDLAKLYFDALRESAGTLLIPAYFYAYARSEVPFDIKHSVPSRELGLLPAYAFNLPGWHRSVNPLSSTLGFGASEWLTKCSGSAYGYNSVFDKLLKIPHAKILFIGVGLETMTAVHHPEALIGSPHLYNKTFLTPILNNRKKVSIPISAQVRYRHLKIDLDSEGNNLKFQEAGLVTRLDVGEGFIRVIEYRKAFNFMIKLLQKDFYAFLKGPPEYKKNELPYI